MSCNIEKSKLNLVNILFGEQITNNLGIAFFVRNCYNICKENKVEMKFKKSFDNISDQLYNDEQMIDVCFGYQYSSFTDQSSFDDLNKCLDTLLVFKILSLI